MLPFRTFSLSMQSIMFLATLLVSATLVQTQSNTIYTQYSMFPHDQCSGQPVFISSSSTGACQIPNAANSTCQSLNSDPSSVYASELMTCNAAPINWGGIVQLFVYKSTWTSSSSCTGLPSSVEATMGDAMCHPAQANKGQITAWLKVNCNGQNPIYYTCKDQGCTNCQQLQYEGNQCTSMGAGASQMVQCYFPPGFNEGSSGNGLGVGDGDNSSASSLVLSAFVTFFLCAWVLVLVQ